MLWASAMPGSGPIRSLDFIDTELRGDATLPRAVLTSYHLRGTPRSLRAENPGLAQGHFRLAIILARPWAGGMLRNARLLARLFAGHAWPGLGRVEVVIGLLADAGYDMAAEARACRMIGDAVSIRPFRWTEVEADAARLIYSSSTVPDKATTVWIPDDGARQFRDADAWIYFSDHSRGIVPWLRPTAVFCADLLPRRVGRLVDASASEKALQALAVTMRGWRSARCVFATTPSTLADVVSYAGVRADRAIYVPLQTEAPVAAAQWVLPRIGVAPGIFWVTNSAFHKNHHHAVRALQAYFAAGGTHDVTIAGFGSQLLDPSTSSGHPGARALSEAPEVLARCRFAGQVSDPPFYRLMAERGIVWHNVLADNGTFTAFDAARVGAHFVSSDYPQIRHLCERHGIAALFHPARDPDAAAAALLEAERRLRAATPPGHALRETTEAELVMAYSQVLDRIAAHD